MRDKPKKAQKKARDDKAKGGDSVKSEKKSSFHLPFHHHHRSSSNLKKGSTSTSPGAASGSSVPSIRITGTGLSSAAATTETR